MMVPCTMWECTSSGLMQPLSEALVVATTNSMKVLRARRPNIVSLTSRNCPIVFHTSVHGWHVLGRNTLALLQSTIHPTTKKQHFLKKNDCLPYHFSSPTRFPGCCYGSPSSLHLRKHPLNSIPEIEDAIVTGIAGLAFSRKQTRFSYIFKLETTHAFQPTSNKHGSWLLFCGRQLSSFQRNAGKPPGFPGFVAWQSTMRPTSTEPQSVKSSRTEECSSIV